MIWFIPIQNALKIALLPLFFNVAWEYAFKNVKENQKELIINEVHSCWYNVNILGESMKGIERQALLIARKETGELLMLSKLSPVHNPHLGLACGTTFPTVNWEELFRNQTENYDFGCKNITWNSKIKLYDTFLPPISYIYFYIHVMGLE
jgi:hypothetical protein